MASIDFCVNLPDPSNSTGASWSSMDQAVVNACTAPGGFTFCWISSRSQSSQQSACLAVNLLLLPCSWAQPRNCPSPK